MAARGNAAVHPEDSLQGFGDFLESVRVGWPTPGVAVAVVKDGSVVYSGAVGLRNVDRELPVTTRTRFPIASATKPFTATAVGMLVDEGELDLDEPLVNRVPDFRLFDDYATTHAGLRDILSHRTGIPAHLDVMWLLSPSSRDELFQRLRYFEPNASFRDQFQYSSITFAAAGTAVERRSGMTWEAFLQRRVFQPLGMRRTGFVAPDSLDGDDVALPYQQEGTSFVPIPFHRASIYQSLAAIGSSGSIVSTVEDMARWVLFILTGEDSGGRRLISARMLEEARSPQVAIRSPYCQTLAQADTYGLGWYVGTYGGRRVVSHGGNSPGFSSMVSFMPALGLGVVVLSNTIDLVGHVISREVYDRFLGSEPTDWTSYFRSLYSEMVLAVPDAGPATISESPTRPPLPLHSYVGEYRHPAFGSVTVSLSDGELLLTFPSGVRSPLRNLTFTAFMGITSEPYAPAIYVTFRLGGHGAVEGAAVALQPGIGEVVFTRVAARE